MKFTVLSNTNLRTANLDAIRDDLDEVLNAAPNEVRALLPALHAGRVNGSTYTGGCACLIGTIAKARKCEPNEIPGLKPNHNRPIERWFLAICPGHTPQNSQVVAITVEWIENWQARRLASHSDQSMTITGLVADAHQQE